MIYHVLNRGNGRRRLFLKDGDYAAFEQVLKEGLERYPVRLLAYCLMPNHWHLVLCPERDEAISELMRWVGVTHVRRYHQHYQSRGGGHLYQGRFKCFPVEGSARLINVMQYVEGNARRAQLVPRAEQWRWGSLWATENPEHAVLPLAAWPIARPIDWATQVNQILDSQILASLRTSVNRGRPYGEAEWVQRTARELGLESSIRPVGRPRSQRASG